MVVDERLCNELTISRDADSQLLRFKLKPSNNGYYNSFSVKISPTGNCQLACATNIGPVLKSLNKYHLRDLFINIRRRVDKRILLLDLNKQYVEHVLECLPKGAILMNSPYISTNCHAMNIILIRLSSVRQLQLPKIK